MGSDADGARAEIEGLTAIARQALHGSRAVTSDRHAVSLRAEVDGASHLLSAAGVDARIAVDVPELPRRPRRCCVGGAGGCDEHPAAQRRPCLHDRRCEARRCGALGDGQRRRASAI